MNERTKCIAKSAVLAALSTTSLLVATYVVSFVVNVLCVAFAAIATSVIVFDKPKRVSWAILIYVASVLLSGMLGGLSRPIAFLVYAIVVAPYLITHVWVDEYIKPYMLRWLIKFVVMTALCLLFFLAMSPLFPSVKFVLDAMASLPMRLFSVDKAAGVAIILSACAVAGGATIPLLDLMVRFVKKQYKRVPYSK